MSMNWGVRGALLTSDHFGASREVKLRFSAAPGLDPWHGLPEVMQRALRALSAISLTSNRWACCPDRLETASLRRANPCRLAFAQRQASCCIQLCIWANASDRGLA